MPPLFPFFVTRVQDPSTKSMALTQIQPQPLSGQIKQMLRDQIVAGVLSPGQRLTETDLADQLSVSRGPLREAIIQLTEEGLLEKAAYKGLRVRTVSQNELRELYSLRTALEQFAFQTAWSRRDDQALANLEARFDRLAKSRKDEDLTEAVDGEIDFHSWVYELSGHSLLQSHWRRLVPLVQIYIALHQRHFGAGGVFMEANQQYLTLAQGDSLTLMQEHILDHMQKGLAEVIASVPDAIAASK